MFTVSLKNAGNSISVAFSELHLQKGVLSDFICRIKEVNQPSFFNAVDLMGAEGANWCLCRATLCYL